MLVGVQISFLAPLIGVIMKETDIISIRDLKLINKLCEMEILTPDDVLIKENIDEEIITKLGLQYQGIRDLLLYEITEELPKYEEFTSYLNNKVYKRFKKYDKTVTIEKCNIDHNFSYLKYPKVDYILLRLGFNAYEIEIIDERLKEYLDNNKIFNLKDILKSLIIDKNKWIKDRKEYVFNNKINLLLEIEHKIKEENILKKTLEKGKKL